MTAADPEQDEGLLAAFWAYERALGADDLAAMDRLFDPAETTLRGDPGGLLVGHRRIHEFRAVRGGVPPRSVVEVHVQHAGPGHALVVAVTEPRRGGRGLQTQLWRRTPEGWRVTAAHVAPPPATFDPSVWRVVGDPLVPAAGYGPLDGASLAVKDLFAVAGHRVGAGVPAFLESSPVARAHATAVARLLAAGASVRGIARTDQLAYSLAGDNAHYGTPVNPVVPGALPGGSSSGSAVAVALGDASIGLATDTAGSVRVPASYQGLWGLRTTHGSVPVDGLVPLAPDFDTVGLLARSPGLLARAASALLAGASAHVGPLAAVATGDVLEGWDVRRVDLPDLAEAAEAFRVHQAYQAWQRHGDFVAGHPGALAGAAAARFETASRITAEADDRAVALLAGWRTRLDGWLGDRVLVLPSTATAAPRLWASAAEVDAARTATLRLTCLAGITGRPAVSAPLVVTPDGPVGVCFVGPRGSDLGLVELAATYVE